MSIPLRVLFIEDNEQDLAMLLSHFARSEYCLTYTCVETAEEMTKALHSEPWDLIISDYCLPEFSGRDALRIAQAVGLDCPFLIVSGNIGEETAVAAMKAGAHDYIFKGNLQRLLPAVTRELHDAAIRREHRETMQVLHETETRYRHLVEHLPATIYWSDTLHPFQIQYISPQIEALLGEPYADLSSNATCLHDAVHPDDRAEVEQRIHKAIVAQQPYHLIYRIVRADQQIAWVSNSAEIVTLANNKPKFIQGILLDITAEKKAETVLRDRETHLRVLANELSRAEDRERQRLATELHDQISQTLAFARMKLRAIMTSDSPLAGSEHLADVWDHLDRAYMRTKTLTFDLYPPILSDLGLGAAIDWLAEQFEAQHSLTIQIHSQGEFHAITPETANILFRATRELLTNVVKHAHATHVNILLHGMPEQIVIRVADNGVGCDDRLMTVLGAAGPSVSFGLFSLRERIQYLGGNVDLSSSLGHGMQVTISLPLPPPDNDTHVSNDIYVSTGENT